MRPAAGTPTLPRIHTEAAFETAIEDVLLANGYTKADPRDFDRVRCLDPGPFLAFVRETQPKEWAHLERLRGDKAAETLLTDLCRALDSPHEGCLSVLRHGFKCYGKQFRAAFFAPASGMNPETRRRYDANRLTVTRQLLWADRHTKELDVALSVNGIPVVTCELKNPLTGQTWQDAVRQYSEDRDPNDLCFQFLHRTLVHFAVDPDEVRMTTRLAGKETLFLPFNRGDRGGAGNPGIPGDYPTAYLWREVLARDSLLDLLARYLHTETPPEDRDRRVPARLIFPRYHQLRAVRECVGDATALGAGYNYLIQHSAGSGKSNTIGWLAHRLASLHDAADRKVFDSVIVVTDRIVLDQQLQDTIYQFEHRQGVVQKITEHSGQLANALASGVPIIITTLQKFPYVTEKIGNLPKRTYAVIIDEAHSSQGGETAIEMKGVLGGAALVDEARAEAEAEGLVDHEEEVLRVMKKRGRQPNISFFAFTATPKYRTIEVFGRPGPDGTPRAFHVYSMRQAIEEGFILDVLAHYTTYATYFRLIKSIEDDPEVDKRKAAQALARFMKLHPYNVAQKTRVMVEHFRTFTRHRIGGRAKGMVVTDSRLQAVRYRQAFEAYLRDKGYTDIGVLVAFSGEVSDPDAPGVTFTEVGMNGGIREKELPKRFASDEFQILIVAEKYQTGFDQPLLHTMYVDKRLAGVAAVQTLSRLNRTAPGKEETFVLDFINTAEEIQEAFQPYYEQTVVGERAEVGQLYDLQARLDGYQVFFAEEVEAFARVFYAPKEKQTAADQAKLYALLRPALHRFAALDEAKQEEFRSVLSAFRNLYGFLSQIIPFQDSDLEKRYTFVRFLIAKLPRRPDGPGYWFDEEVALQFYRLQKISEGAIPLEKGGGYIIDGPTSVGTGYVAENPIELSRLIEILNEHFGTDFTEADQLFFDSIRETAVRDPRLRRAAMVNSIENFELVFADELSRIFSRRMDQNEKIADRFFSEEAFRYAVSKYLLQRVFEEINGPSAQEAI